jgi:hypothetical protein
MSGRVLIWNPGQGHIPLYLLNKYGAGNLSLTLAGRDLLSLVISNENCLAAGVRQELVRTCHVALPVNSNDSYDHVIIFPETDPGIPWQTVIFPQILNSLKEGASVVIAAKSAFMARLIDLSAGIKIIRDKRAKGYRAVIVKKKN